MKYYLVAAALFLCCSNGYAQTVLEKANTCYNDKNYQCALDNYLISLNDKTYKESDKYLVEYRIGTCYSNLAQDSKALDYFQRSSISNPNYMYGFWGIADSYFNMGKKTEALDNYKKAYSLASAASEKENLAYLLGESYYGLKRYTEALAEYKKVTLRTAGYENTDNYIGDAFFNLTKYDSAIVYYQKGEQYYKSDNATYKKLKLFEGKSYRLTSRAELAEKCFDEAIAIDGKYGAAFWEKGILHANKQDYTTAIDLYKKALANFTPADTSDNYVLCGNITACYRELKNYTEEMNWMQQRKAYSKNPYIEIASIATIQYKRLKKNADAEKTCVDAINRYQLEPETMRKTNEVSYIKLNNIAGKIALEKKDTVKAQKYFDEALKLSKTSYEANAGAAEIAWNRKDNAAYRKYFNNIIKYNYDTSITSKKEIANVYGRSAYTEAYVDGKSTSSYSYWVYSALQYDSLQKEAVLLWPIVLSNSTYDLSNNRSACLSILNKAITQYGADKEYLSDLYNSKAVITVQTDTAVIRKCLEEAVKIYPSNTRPWDNLLKFYSSYDNAKGAVMVDKLIDVLKKKKDNATLSVAYVYKGDFFWRQSKKEEAKKAYQEALVWDANNTTAKDRVKLD